MHFLYIGLKDGGLFLERGTQEVYRIPFGLRGSSKETNFYSAVAGLLMFISPLVYQYTKSPAFFLSLTLLSFLIVAIILIKSAKIRDHELEDFVVQFPFSKVEEDILPYLRKYVILNMIRVFFITLFLLLFEIGGLYFTFIEKGCNYRLLLSLNLPTGILLVWSGFRPISVIIACFKYQNMRRR